VRPREWRDDTFVEIAATPDGAWALGEALVPGAERKRIGPAMMDRSTGRVTVIRPFSNPLNQVVSMAGDDGWVAWVEGSLQPSFVDWAIFTYDRRNHEIRQVAAAPKYDGTHYPITAYVSLSMSRGVIVWSAVEAADGVYHVYAINADGTGLRVLAADARGPQIVGASVMYDAKPTTPGPSDQLTLQDLESGRLQKVTGPTSVSYFAYDGSAVAWIPADTNDIYLQSPIDAPPVHIFSGSFLQFVSINARLVGWGQDLGAFAYDRKLHVVVRLSNLYDLYPVISDRALDWVFQPDPAATNPFDNTIERALNVRDLR
jgi:hypothetical protein